MGVNWIGLIVVGCFLLHRVVHVERSRARNLVTFGALSVVGFGEHSHLLESKPDFS